MVLPELERRRVATQKTLDRYRPKVFNWGRGVHCVSLARFQMVNMGHKVPTLPRVRSALAAKREMKARGWASVTEMLDSMLPPIAPAMMLLGDLASVPGTEGLDSVLVCAGPQKFMGWHPTDGTFVVYDSGMEQIDKAWRV